MTESSTFHGQSVISNRTVWTQDT